VTSRPAVTLLRSSLGDATAPSGLAVGAAADLCIFAAEGSWTVEPGKLSSRGRHTPFAGHELPGRVRWTLVAGRVAFEDRSSRAAR
jgi:dihydroorotase